MNVQIRDIRGLIHTSEIANIRALQDLSHAPPLSQNSIKAGHKLSVLFTQKDLDALEREPGAFAFGAFKKASRDERRRGNPEKLIGSLIGSLGHRDSFSHAASVLAAHSDLFAGAIAKIRKVGFIAEPVGAVRSVEMLPEYYGLGARKALLGKAAGHFLEAGLKEMCAHGQPGYEPEGKLFIDSGAVTDGNIVGLVNDGSPIAIYKWDTEAMEALRTGANNDM